MGEMDQEKQLQLRHQRERQYRIDQITYRYAEDYRAGRAPRLEDYVRQYPDLATELTEFVFYFHSVGLDVLDVDTSPAPDLSPAAQRALAQIRERHGAAALAPFEGLVNQGTRFGYTPRQLAEAVGLSTDVLAKLEAHVIAATTIPRTLIQRLADTLKVTPDTVAAFLGSAGPAGAGAFYYADQTPTQQQESFLDAVRASGLSSERKNEWAELVRQDTTSQG